MKVYVQPNAQLQQALCQRPAIDPTSLRQTVSAIFEEVTRDGDLALRRLTHKFDDFLPEELVVDLEKMQDVFHQIEPGLKEAIHIAARNIRHFHETQKEQIVKVTSTPGVECWRESRAIEKVGLYIPGGTAPLFSTVLMLGIPAKIAGCAKIVLCTPPDQYGEIHPAILYAAHVAGIKEICRIGGAQAIAAMTIGTESVTKCHKIFGPGNQYVTAAKLLAQERGVAIDMPAGPSEVLVYADRSAHPTFIAADLLSQAEHGEDSQVVLVADQAIDLSAIQSAINQMLEMLPRKALVRKALEHSFFVQCKTVQDSFDFINQYAPEHLIIACKDPEKFISQIQHAGSVFLGHMTPESAGDYASGTNHTLPTAGFARNYSGVSLDSFVKKITFQHINELGIRQLGPIIETLALAEQLDAHALAVTVRLNQLK